MAYCQGNDQGTQYRGGIYYHSEDQRVAAEAAKARMQQQHSKPVVTEILPAAKWWPAEHYHQQYLEKVRCRENVADMPVVLFRHAAGPKSTRPG